MRKQIRVRVTGKDSFWSRAFEVEWEYQFPNRRLTADETGSLLVDWDWFEDVEQVASQCFCEVVRAPDNPKRRSWLRLLMGSSGDS